MSPSPARAVLTGKLWCAVILAQFLSFSAGGFAHAPLSSKLQRLDTLIAQSPADPELLIQRAQVYSDQGNFERAKLDLDLADSLDDSQKSGFTRAVMLYRRGDLEKSRQQLNRTLDANPNNMAALEYRARIHRDLSRTSAAIADFEALIEQQDNINPGYYLAAAKLRATDDSGVEDALALLDQGMLRLGLIPQLQTYAVTLELRHGDTKAAISRHLSLRSLLNNSPDWKADIARLYTLHNQPELALDYYHQAQLQLSDLRPTLARQNLAIRVEAHIMQLQQP
jgi:tetratricopeptide (TPR) repeat protein